MSDIAWKELIRRYYDDAIFEEPATENQIRKAEKALGVQLPEELRSVLLLSNGVTDGGMSVIWPLKKIISNNHFYRTDADYRELFMPFDHLLFFADASNGDLFAYAILAGEIRKPDVFAWNHEDDSRKWVAPSLETYLEWWSTGDIEL